MKLNRRAHYSIKAMLDLVIHAQSRPISVKEIAKRQSIPAAFLEQILLDLRRADLVVSSRGVLGGYQLQRSPNQISLAQILTAVGEQHPLPAPKEQASDIVTLAVWQRLDQAFQTALQNINLEELYFDAQSWQASRGAVFIV
ncbi:MAG: Rrf2 family transcriptional regulator [Pseudanabaenaceae cyanobacterium bins.68]|nr:Rrf2 family transcriptional regulator [Pseudanabaenaceae cyanobacterium bins.68]